MERAKNLSRFFCTIHVTQYSTSAEIGPAAQHPALPEGTERDGRPVGFGIVSGKRVTLK